MKAKKERKREGTKRKEKKGINPRSQQPRSDNSGTQGN
jgi:hypothetical protein